jgi:hypothetical protein
MEGSEEAASGVALAFDEGILFVKVIAGEGVAGEDAFGLPGGEGFGSSLEAAFDRAVTWNGREFDVGGIVRGAGEELCLGVRSDDVVGWCDDVGGSDPVGVVAEASEGPDLGDGGGSCGSGRLCRWVLWA